MCENNKHTYFISYQSNMVNDNVVTDYLILNLDYEIKTEEDLYDAKLKIIERISDIYGWKFMNLNTILNISKL